MLKTLSTGVNMGIKRIKYLKTDKPGILQSLPIKCDKNGKYYVVILDENELMFYVKSVNQQRIIVKGGEGVNSRHVLLRKIKQRLAKMGFKFDIEVRNI